MADDIVTRRGFSNETRIGKTDVWLTPKSIIDLLGPFDLDPCAATNPPWATATHMITETDDGLTAKWDGIAWVNPPYSNAWAWLDRLANHGNGIALVLARTETAGFHRSVWQRADGIAFPKRRIRFCYPSGEQSASTNGAPSCFVAYGDEAVQRLYRLQETAVIELKEARRG